jgi:radial spoke head protein 4A
MTDDNSVGQFLADGQEYMSKTGLDTHLQLLLQDILQSRTPETASQIELVSKILKKTPEPRLPDKATLRACKKELLHFKKPVPPPTLEEGEEDDAPPPEDPPAEEGNDGQIEDVTKTMRLMSMANLGLADDEVFRLHLALKKLAKSQPVEKVRFWGKINGTQQDYYIAEAVMKDGSREPPPAEEEEPPAEEDGDPDAPKEPKPPKIPQPPMEEPGTADDVIVKSPNQYMYYVCSRPDEPWVRLPDIKPIHISGARSLRRLFTGKLDTPVYGCPPFPGKEQELLRATIARISHCCALAPRQCFGLEGEEGEEQTVTKAELGTEPGQFSGVNAAEMAPTDTATGWVHAYLDILPQGRCAFWETEADTAAREALAAAAEEEGKPPPPAPEGSTHPKPLRNIHEDDEVIPGHAAAWTTRSMASHVPEYAKAVARSNWWPGACTVAFGTEYYNLYMGWGQKAVTTEGCRDIFPIPGDTHGEVEVEMEEQDDLNLKPPQAAAAEEAEE